jgi:hypothetical protein
MKVKCPNCGRMDFDTTDKYNPDVTPNGSMVKSNLTYHIDWLCLSTTLASEMTCPECLAQFAPSGRLLVVPSKSVDRRLDAQIPRIDVDVEALADKPPFNVIVSDEVPAGTILAIGKLNAPDGAAAITNIITPKVGTPVFICEVCGKETKTASGMSSHMKTHEEK